MTTETFLRRNEINEVHPTLRNMLNDLREAEKAHEGDYNQLVIQLNPEQNGKQWKLFVYYDAKAESFYFSYQDEDYEDTIFTRGYSYDQMMQQIVDDIMAVGDFEWIELS